MISREVVAPDRAIKLRTQRFDQDRSDQRRVLPTIITRVVWQVSSREVTLELIDDG